MTDVVPVFDPTQKKKKKKPAASKAADDAPETTVAAAAETTPAAEEKTKAEEQHPAKAEEAAAVTDDIADFGKKKKKPSKKTAAAATEPAEAAAETKKTKSTEEAAPTAEAAPAAKTEAAASAEETRPVARNTASMEPGMEPWAGTDREYQYDELLARIFDILRKNNPDFGSRSATIFIKPPQVGREGPKKTVWFNFTEICDLLHRKPDHMFAFVCAELGTSASMDGSNHLIIRGRYMPRHIETIIKKYIREYVVCNTCNQLTTTLKKENRLTFVVCNKCNSSRSVAAIKKGFEAQVTKRKHDA